MDGPHSNDGTDGLDDLTAEMAHCSLTLAGGVWHGGPRWYAGLDDGSSWDEFVYGQGDRHDGTCEGDSPATPPASRLATALAMVAKGEGGKDRRQVLRVVASIWGVGQRISQLEVCTEVGRTEGIGTADRVVAILTQLERLRAVCLRGGVVTAGWETCSCDQLDTWMRCPACYSKEKAEAALPAELRMPGGHDGWMLRCYKCRTARCSSDCGEVLYNSREENPRVRLVLRTLRLLFREDEEVGRPPPILWPDLLTPNAFSTCLLGA